jgi:hypothetical protein
MCEHGDIKALIRKFYELGYAAGLADLHGEGLPCSESPPAAAELPANVVQFSEFTGRPATERRQGSDRRRSRAYQRDA